MLHIESLVSGCSPSSVQFVHIRVLNLQRFYLLPAVFTEHFEEVLKEECHILGNMLLNVFPRVG